MVAKILRAEATAPSIQIEFPTKVNVELNEKVAQELGITFPESLKKKPTEDGGSKL
jgi:ABC-type uncharacterized transport system substrate-binding protein